MDTYDVETHLAPSMNVMCIGQRGSGKTTLLKYLLYCMRNKHDAATVCCCTSDSASVYAPHVSRACIYTGRVTSNDIFALHAELHGRVCSSSAIVFDDCLDCFKQPPSGLLEALLSRNTQVLTCVQYPRAFPKGTRAQFDVVIVFPRTEAMFCAEVHQCFLNDVFQSGEELQEAFRTLRRHEALVFDARLHRAGRPCLFALQAPTVLPPFFLGPRDAKPAKCSVADAVLPMLIAAALGIFVWLLA